MQPGAVAEIGSRYANAPIPRARVRHDETPVVAYVVICWNNRDIVGECLSSILTQESVRPVVYVLDNASSDGTPEYIAENFPDAILVISASNVGFARGSNLLIKSALQDTTADYIALVNSDAVLGSHWTSRILEHIGDRKNVAAAQGLTLDYSDRTVIDSQHIYVGRNLQFNQFGYGRPLDEAETSPHRVFGVNAAAAIFTREFIEAQPESDLFDESLYMYLEDIDVAFRAFMDGWESYSVPEAIAYHRGSASSTHRAKGFGTYLVFRNNLPVLAKNLPVSLLARSLPRAFVAEFICYSYLVRDRGLREVLYAFAGRMAGLWRTPAYLRHRRVPRSPSNFLAAGLQQAMTSRGILDSLDHPRIDSVTAEHPAARVVPRHVAC